MNDLIPILLFIGCLCVAFGTPLCLMTLIVLVLLPAGRRLIAWCVAFAVGLACGASQVWFWNDGIDSNSSMPMIFFAPAATACGMVVTALLLVTVNRLSSSTKPGST